MHRRIVLTIAGLLVLAGLTAAPAAQARPAPAAGPASLVAAQAAFARQMEAQGWTTATPTFKDLPDAMQALPSNIRAGLGAVSATTQVICDQQGFWNGNKGWYNPNNGRFYYIWGAASVCVNANLWRPLISIWSKRQYGNLTVDGHFTLYWDHFRALTFAGAFTEPSTIEGERNPADVSCTSQVQRLEGVDRTRVVSRPWAMSFIGYVAMDFRQPDCSFVHQTIVRSLGSYRVAGPPAYSTSYDDARTGWI